MESKEFLIQIGKYITKNKWVMMFFLLAILVGATNIFGLGKPLAYKSWELSSFAFTLGYTLAFYIYFYKNGYFANLGGDKTFAIAVALFALVVINLFISNEYTHLFTFSPTRTIMLLSLCIFASIFAWVNWALYKHFEKMLEQNAQDITNNENIMKLANDFRNSVFTSDLPLALSFLILAVYCYFNNHKANMDYFFSGSIVFQMMYSNAVWIFNDDKVFENLEKLKLIN